MRSNYLMVKKAVESTVMFEQCLPIFALVLLCLLLDEAMAQRDNKYSV